MCQMRRLVCRPSRGLEPPVTTNWESSGPQMSPPIIADIIQTSSEPTVQSGFPFFEMRRTGMHAHLRLLSYPKHDLFPFAAAPVGEEDGRAGIEEGQPAQTMLDRREIERAPREDLAARKERDLGSTPGLSVRACRGSADNGQGRFGVAHA